MKKLILLLIIPFTALLITSCDSGNDPITPTPQGNIFLSSNPAGAQILLDGTNTSKITPDTIKKIDVGVHTLALILPYYNDTTFTVTVTEGQTSDVGTVVLVSNIGNIFLASNPAGAQIWLDGTNTLKTTPDTIKRIDEGVHSVTIKLQDYNDTTFSVTVSAGQTSFVGTVVLVSNIMKTLYGPIRIYETIGTGANEPSGLDLSSGNAWGVSSDSSGLVDIYYSSTGFLVQSADLYPNLVRETDFFVASLTNLFDGEDSPLRNTGTWTNNIDDREANYVFLYDHDGYYSKLKIVNWGGGVVGEPAWVEVQWYYNNTLLDNRF